jgi:acetyl esterase/lipase
VVGIAFGVGALAIAALRATPWPGALVIRSVFDRDARRKAVALLGLAPKGIESVLDVSYRLDDRHAKLDVYFPAGTIDPLPVIVWTHGGAWISGSRRNAAGYFQLLAAEGFTVVAVDYSLGPGRRYPAALHQLNDALGFLCAHADELHIDPSRFVLAGDSAGAQLSSQLGALTTDAAYAELVDVRPALQPQQLRGLVLHCGIYEIGLLLRSAGLLKWGNTQALWAYTGSADPARSSALAQMSTAGHVTAAFPATFLSGGNGDPLTNTQSKPLAAALEALGVEVTTLFWPDDHQPALPHEYQFVLNEAGRTAFDESLAFIRARTAS